MNETTNGYLSLVRWHENGKNKIEIVVFWKVSDKATIKFLSKRKTMVNFCMGCVFSLVQYPSLRMDTLSSLAVYSQPVRLS